MEEEAKAKIGFRVSERLKRGGERQYWLIQNQSREFGATARGGNLKLSESEGSWL